MNGWNMDVDVKRLRTHLERITRHPRPAESRSLDECREYVESCLKDFGWTIERREFFASLDQFGVLALSGNSGSLKGINLVARRPNDPTRGGPRFCVGA